MAEHHEGGCLCGAVRYRARGPATRTLVCHCRACQRMTGSSFYANSVFPEEAVEFTGKLQVYEHTSATSGKAVYLHSCPACATTVSLTFERWPGSVAISRGTFDDPDRLPVDAHIWTESAQAGVMLPADTDCYRQGRMRLDGAAEAAERFLSPVVVRVA